MAKTVLQEVTDQMQEMLTKKEKELRAINKKALEAQEQREAAIAALKDATARMDLEAYEEAKREKERTQAAIDMYSARYEQINDQEYISEAESDKAIDRLLEYENELDNNFREAISEPLKVLRQIVADYRKEINETEQTMVTWQQNIHANYSSRGGTIYKETGTDRSKTPIPVHAIAYRGCVEAERLTAYLDREAKLLRDGE